MATQFKTVSKFIAATGVLAALGSVSTAHAATVSRVDAATFGPEAGRITFSELGFAPGTVNPVYNPAQYGGGINAPIVSFGGLFSGQTVTTDTAFVTGNPTGTLALTGNTRIIGRDDANPSAPVLSGAPTFSGPVSILFSRNVSAVGIDAGFFDRIGSTAITAFDRNGVNLGSLSNAATGIEFLGLVTDDGSNQIAGLQFSSLSADASGFAIDNVRFNAAVNSPVEEVPEPFTIVGTIIGGSAAMRMRKKLKANDKV
ncbi:PEP-CTERM sorting domain-containing protein [Chamaesiphon sp. VAR_48_metabat_403]|uniref:PEP-CTERM sorting domain-containing protein n=1 Tax=Chamaesiphon sp. VAR_48_metabat_403 TaxID=2964700 RepID=UPI00286E2525|nr:PEP-CTERM sorting domain-containing protein [Chamaesiphon sp. VAR_48_metabat_403]